MTCWLLPSVTRLITLSPAKLFASCATLSAAPASFTSPVSTTEPLDKWASIFWPGTSVPICARSASTSGPTATSITAITRLARSYRVRLVVPNDLPSR